MNLIYCNVVFNNKLRPTPNKEPNFGIGKQYFYFIQNSRTYDDVSNMCRITQKNFFWCQTLHILWIVFNKKMKYFVNN